MSPQEDLRALQVCARGACRALGAGPAGKDDDEAGVRLPETLHLRRRLGLRLRGVRMGPTWAQARTGKSQGAEQTRSQDKNECYTGTHDALCHLDMFIHTLKEIYNHGKKKNSVF